MEKLIIVAMLTAMILLFGYITYINLFCPKLKEETKKRIEKRIMQFLSLFSHISKRGC